MHSFPTARSRPIHLALAVALFASAAASPRPARAGRLVPDREAVPSAQLSGRAIDLTQGGLRIRVEPLDNAQVAEWFRTRTRGAEMALPLDGVSPDEDVTQKARSKKPAASLLVFSVSLENLTGGDVTFVPELSSYEEEHGVEHSPLPGDWLRALLLQSYGATKDPERAADDAMVAIHADAIVLKNGQRSSGLLFFPPEPKSKRITLTLGHVAVGSRDVSPVFPFVAARDR